MTLIKIGRSQQHQQQADPLPVQPAIDFLDNRTKFFEVLYDSQIEGGQHILQIKMAEALSRIIEVYWLERRWLA